MARSKNSERWLKEHFSDPFVKRAQREGHRSRASFKLIELQEKYQLIRQGMTVVDVGAAPGSWSELAAKWVGPQGRVIAIDLLPLAPIAQVTFIQGDIMDPAIDAQVAELCGEHGVNFLLSDVSPNMTGHIVVDQARSMEVVLGVIDLASRLLKKKGSLLTKIFQGAHFDKLVKSLRLDYDKVVICKPEASRSRSREVYILAQGFKHRDINEVSH